MNRGDPGPGKYDTFCTYVREQTDARAAIVIVIDGDLGSGFSLQTNGYQVLELARMLENMAAAIRQRNIQ